MQARREVGLRITGRGWLQHLRSARLGATAWLCAFVWAVTAVPVLHTAFHDAAHGLHAAHATAHDPFALPSYIDVFGEEPPHHHGDGELHTHEEPQRSAIEELDPLLALQLASPAHGERHGTSHAHHDAKHGDAKHGGAKHGEGSLEHLDAAWLAEAGVALLPPAAAIAGFVATVVEAPALPNYLLAPLEAQAPPASAANV